MFEHPGDQDKKTQDQFLMTYTLNRNTLKKECNLYNKT